MRTIMYGGLEYVQVRNAIYCKKCKSTIESKYEHDYKMCPCGAVGIDGGLSDSNHLIGYLADMEDRSMYCAQFRTINQNHTLWLPENIIEKHFNQTIKALEKLHTRPSLR